MWGVGNPAASMNAIYGGSMMTSAVATPAVSASTAQQKNDIFVGNLAFNTTEEQLHTIFSEIGRVINVRMVLDQETGKMRGFAFVEMSDANEASAAIEGLNDQEIVGLRRLGGAQVLEEGRIEAEDAAHPLRLVVGSWGRLQVPGQLGSHEGLAAGESGEVRSERQIGPRTAPCGTRRSPRRPRRSRPLRK